MAMVVSPSVSPQVVAFSTPAGVEALTESLRGRVGWDGEIVRVSAALH